MGKPVDRSHKIFKEDPNTNFKDSKSAADYLSSLASSVLCLKMCSGIVEYSHQWHSMEGTIHHSASPETPIYRSSLCQLLLDHKNRFTICSNCQCDLRKMKKRAELDEKAQNNPSNIPDSLLSKEGMKVKKDRYMKEARYERKKARRLERRLEKMKLKLDQIMKDDLMKTLISMEGKMSKLQKTFWQSQAETIKQEDSRGLRWHPMLIKIALKLQTEAPGAIEVLNGMNVIKFPSNRRLYDYSHYVDAVEGCQKEIIEDIKAKIDKCGSDDHFKYVNLMFDEMNIRAGLVTNRSTGELIGFTKLGNLDQEIRELQCELEMRTYKPRLAKKVLVFMVKGITSSVKDVVSVHSTDDLTCSTLYNLTWDVIYHLEHAGIKVLAVTCDGAAVNRKFILMHHSLDPTSKNIYITKNLASGCERPLFFVLDPPHLLKAIRNAFANSFSHKKARKLWKNDEYLSWQVIETLYHITEREKLSGTKLTKAHVKLNAFSCMTVKYATQVLSNSVAKSISDLSGHNSFEGLDTCEVVKFIRIMNKFFDCLNGKEEETEESKESLKNPDKKNYRSLEDERFSFLENDVLDYFEDWKDQVKKRPGIFTETERNQMIISHQALGALETTVKGIVGAVRFMLQAGAPSVSARNFNQDPLEQYFSKMRRKGGSNTNPSLPGVLHGRLSEHSAGELGTGSFKGNTEVSKRKEIEFSEEPLRSRKVQRK